MDSQPGCLRRDSRWGRTTFTASTYLSLALSDTLLFSVRELGLRWLPSQRSRAPLAAATTTSSSPLSDPQLNWSRTRRTDSTAQVLKQISRALLPLEPSSSHFRPPDRPKAPTPSTQKCRKDSEGRHQTTQRHVNLFPSLLAERASFLGRERERKESLAQVGTPSQREPLRLS